MNNWIKKLFVVIISLMLMIPSSFIRVYAQEDLETIEEINQDNHEIQQLDDVDDSDQEYTNVELLEYFVNPVYEGIFEESELVSQEDIDYEYNIEVDTNEELVLTIEDAAQLLYRMTRVRKQNIAIRFYYETNDIQSIINAVYDRFQELCDDYTLNSVLGGQMGFSGRYMNDGDKTY